MALAEAPQPNSSGGADLDAVLAQLDDRVATAAGARNVADADLCSLMADVLETRAWEQTGIHSETHWATWQFGISHGRARQKVRVARRWPELPHATARFSRGELSFDQMSIIARLCPAGFDQSVAQFAISATLPQLNTNLRAYDFDYDASIALDPPPDRVPTNTISRGFSEDGRYQLNIDADNEAGALIDSSIEQAFDRLRAAAPTNQHHDEPNTDNSAQAETGISLFDAVADVFATAASADPSESRRRRFQPLVHIDVDALIARDADNLIGRLHLGPLLTKQLTALALCDSAPAIVAYLGGVPLAKGRATDKIPPALRTLIHRRDNGCRVCGSTRNLHVHHMQHWIHGGPTDPDNLVTLCNRHHVLVHKGVMDIQGDPTKLHDAEALRITNRDGNRIKPPVPLNPGRSEQASGPKYQHPVGERFDARRHWLQFDPNVN